MPSTATVNKPIDIDWHNFVDHIDTALLNASKLTRLPVNAGRWEEVLEATFRRTGYLAEWTPDSHGPGTDIDYRTLFVTDFV